MEANLNNWELSQCLIVQNDQAICTAVYQAATMWGIQLHHRQIVRGIPSFRLTSAQDVISFQNGFLYGELQGGGRAQQKDYEFYCSVMQSAFPADSIILPLFNVRNLHDLLKQIGDTNAKPKALPR
jgi:hypothetical protein